MKKIQTEDLRTICGLLLNGGINVLVASATGGVVANTTVLGELVKSVTGNLASNHIAKLSNHGFQQIVSRLKENDPTKVNHDLERLFRDASVKSLVYIKDLFLQDLTRVAGYENLNKKEKTSFNTQLEAFFNENIEDLENSIKTIPREPLDKSLVKDPREYLDNITQQIFRVSSVEFDKGTEQTIRNFYANNLPYCFEIAFKEALKHDDLGFKAFQIWTIEEMQKQNMVLAEGQQTILAILEDLKNGKSYLNKAEEEEKWERVTTRIYDLLKEGLAGIKAIVTETNAIAKETNERTKKLLDFAEDEKNKRPKPISPALTAAPHKPQYFIGRDEELETIKQRLHSGDGFLPVFGEGGLGKSSFVSAYYHKYCHEYAHYAWVLNKGNIIDALLSLEEPLNLSFGEAVPISRRIIELTRAMASLPKPCLLIIDNVDEPNDFHSNHQLLRSFPQFHVLVTTRIKKFGATEAHKLEPLPQTVGLQLFTKHYGKHSPAEDQLFYEIFNSVGGNTLVIELLAKNLKTINRHKLDYTLRDLLHELQKEGVLALSKTKKVGDVDYHAEGGVMRTDTPQSIIMAMYEITNLSEGEVAVLSVFSVLPPDGIPYDVLELLLSGTHELDDILETLHSSGWLDFNETTASYKISPVIQDIVRKKNKGLLQNINPPIQVLQAKLLDPSHADGSIFLRYAINVYKTLAGMESYAKENLTNEENRQLGYLCFSIAFRYHTLGNALLADRFVKDANAYYEIEMNEAFLEALKNKKDDKTLSRNELFFIADYIFSLELAASIKCELGFLRESEDLFNLAKRIAYKFNIEFNHFAHNRYMVKAGRLMEAEPFFYNLYKENKDFFNSLSSVSSEDDFIETLKIFKETEPTQPGDWRLAHKKILLNTLGLAANAALELAKIFRIQGRFEEAVYFHKKFLKLTEEGDPQSLERDTVIGLHSMAMTLLMEGKEMDEAEQILNKVSSVYNKIYSSDHLSIGQQYANLFKIALKKGEGVLHCLRLYQKARTIISENLGENSTGVTEMNIHFYEYLIKIIHPDKICKILLRNVEEYILKNFVRDFSLTTNRFGIYHPEYHHGLEIAAQILDKNEQSKTAEQLRNIRKEYMRILHVRIAIRTYDMHSRTITDENEKIELIRKIKKVTSLPLNRDEFQLDIIDLPFYKKHDLCRILFLNTAMKVYKYVLLSPENVIALENSNKPLYILGESDLELNDESAKRYASFFLDGIAGRHGKVFILNDHTEIPWKVDLQLEDNFKIRIGNIVPPMKIISSSADEYVIYSYYLFKEALFESHMKINRKDGTIEFDREGMILIDIANDTFIPVKYTDENEYIKNNPNCKLINKIPASIDPSYFTNKNTKEPDTKPD